MSLSSNNKKILLGAVVVLLLIGFYFIYPKLLPPKVALRAVAQPGKIVEGFPKELVIRQVGEVASSTEWGTSYKGFKTNLYKAEYNASGHPSDLFFEFKSLLPGIGYEVTNVEDLDEKRMTLFAKKKLDRLFVVITEVDESTSNVVVNFNKAVQ
jgi:hypothetical protein